MKAIEREIVINDTWAGVIYRLSNKKAGKLFKKVIRYSRHGVDNPTKDKDVDAMFSAIREDMDMASFKEA